jgi:hypothetical protein
VLLLSGLVLSGDTISFFMIFTNFELKLFSILIYCFANNLFSFIMSCS